MNEGRTIKQRAIAHYERMIKFAMVCKESGERFPKSSVHFFMDNIDECWHGDYCSYCIKYYYEKPNNYKLFCGGCPLNPDESKDPEYCCGRLWNRISIAATWDTLIKALTDVKNYIEIWG